MRILQINNCHFRRGGADVVYLNTGNLLEKKGHDVFYFSSKSEKNYPVNTENFFVKPIDFFNRSLLSRAISFPRFLYSKEAKNKLGYLIKDCKPEIAHIHTYKGTLTPSILEVLKSLSIPIVISLHDYGFLCPHNLMLNGKMEICEKCVSGSSFNCFINKCNRNSSILSLVSTLEFIYHNSFYPYQKYFNKVIAVSKFGQLLHNKSKKLNIKVQHLYNFFPNLQNTQINNSLGEYFLFFGRLSKEKGTKTLINAWTKQSRKSILKIVGTGELFNELYTQSRSYDSIEILGFKHGRELNDLIYNASFIIVPSEWYENNPLAIIESYAMGKPVIGANVGGIPEIIKDGETGFLFEMKNADDLSDKISFAEDISEEAYRRMSESARLFAEVHFNPDLHYNELIKIYQETIENPYNE